MINTPGPDDLLIRYLLGQSSEEDQVRLEQEFFADEDSYQQLLAVEDELTYEYARGGLTPHQRQAFEARFLRTPAAREKVALAKAVLDKTKEVSAATAAAFAPAPRAGKAGWWKSLANLLTLPSPGMRLAFNAATVLVIAGGVWMLFQGVQLRRQTEELAAERASYEQKARQLAAAGDTERADLNRELTQEQQRLGELERELAKRPAASSLFGFLLTPGLTRDTEGPKRLVVPADAGQVHFQLQVKSPTRYRSFNAELQNLDGEQLWSQNVAQAACDIPARLLPPGDYVIELKGIAANGGIESAGEFYFTVVRR